MKQRITCVFLFLVLVFCSRGYSQDITTQGKEFYLSFFKNNNSASPTSGDSLRLFITSTKNTTGTVSNPRTSYSQNYSVTANTVTIITLPFNECVLVDTAAPNRVIKVTANDTISLYSLNQKNASTDASIILPTPALGQNYMIMSFTPGNRSMGMVVAVENNTRVQITPKVALTSGRPAGIPFTITLNAAQAYFFESTSQDLSGTLVNSVDSCKRIAVYGGVGCANVPTGCSYCDHIYEQHFPIETWGQNFIFTTSRSRNHDYIRIVARDNGTTVTINGSSQTLNATNSILQACSTNAKITADKPIAVMGYLVGQTCGGSTFGDPDMFWVAPTEQTLNKVVFCATPFTGININYVNIVTRTRDTSRTYFNGVKVKWDSFAVIAADTNYAVAKLVATPGSNYILCDSGFSAYSYGLGPANSYAYATGSSARGVNITVEINGESYDNKDTGYVCYMTPANFELAFNQQYNSLRWYFGDGDTSSSPTPTHSYDSTGPYHLLLLVNRGGNCSSLTDTFRMVIYMRPPLDVSLPNDTLRCFGNTINLHANATGGRASTYSYNWNMGTPSAGGNMSFKLTQDTTVRVILSDGCTNANDTDFMVITTRPPLNLTMSLSGDTVLCTNDSVLVNVFGSGGDSSYTFTWNNGKGTGTSKYLKPNASPYRVILSDGCSSTPDTLTFIISQPVALQVTAMNDTTICHNSFIKLRATASGGIGGYAFSWNNGLGTGDTVTTQLSATTTFTVVLTVGCNMPNDTDQVTVYVRPPLDITLRPDTTICTGNSVALNTVRAGGDSTYTVTWDNGLGTGISKTVSPATTTTYRAILDDGCTIVKDTAYVTVYVRPALDLTLSTDTTICRGISVDLNATATGGDSSYTVTWNNGLGTGITKNVSPASTTTYRAILDDGCTVTKDTGYVIVFVRLPLDVILPPDTIICQGNAVTLTPVTSGGDSTYDVSWSHGLGSGTSKTVSPDTTTTYFASLDDGCTPVNDTDYVTVYVRPPLNISLRPDTTICRGNSVQLTPVFGGGDSSYTITWDNGLGTGTSKTVSPATTTTYMAILDDGCTPLKDTAYVTIFVRPALDIVLRPDTTICRGNSVDLNPVTNGGDSSYTITWDNGLGTGTSKTVSPVNTTTYRVILDDGCTPLKDTAYVTVYVRPPLDITLRPDTTICQGNAVTLTPVTSGGDSTYTLTWDNGLGTGTSKTVSPATTTTYMVSLDDGCTPLKDTAYVTVYVRPPLDISLRSDTIICRGNSVQLTPVFGGGDSSYTITWDNGLGTGTSKTVSPLTTTTYMAVLDDGCTPRNDTAYVTIFVRPALDITLRPDTTICLGNQVDLDIVFTGGDSTYSITWDNGLGTGIFKTVSPATTTTYMAILDDGCTPLKDTDYVTVYVRPALDITLRPDTTICKGNPVLLAPVAAGGDSSYTLTWDNGLGTGTSKTVSPDTTTTYRVILSDGCSTTNDSATVTVFVRPPLSSIRSSDTTICFGTSVNLTVTPAGGDSTHTLTWDNGLGTGTSKTVSPVDTTTYTIVLSDGCTVKNDTALITVSVLPSLYMTVSPDTTLCLGQSYTIQATESGGVAGTRVISWNNGLGTGNSKIVSPDTTTLYTLTLSDGCSVPDDIKNVNITVRPALQMTISNDTAICLGERTVLRAFIQGGRPWTRVVTWDNGLGTGDSIPIDPLVTTTYRAILSDSCSVTSDTQYVTVYVKEPLDVTASPDTTICKGTGAEIRAKGFGGQASSYLFTWDNGLGTGIVKNVNPTVTTTYSVILKDLCTSREDTAFVTVFVRPDLQITVRDTMLCHGDTLAVTPVLSGGDSTYSLTWDQGSSTSFTRYLAPQTTTTYNLVLSDGCTPASDTANLTLYIRPPLDVIMPENVLVCQGVPVMLNPVLTGGDSSYTVYWNNGLGTGNSKTVTPDTTTTYQVILDDGCTPAKDTGYVTVFVRPPLDIVLRTDTTICQGNSVLLNVISFGGGDSSYTITWDNGLGTGTSKTVSPAVTTTYRVILDDGCTPAKDTAYVTVFVRPPLDIALRADTTICQGNSVLLAPAVLGGDSSYTITWDNGLGTGTSKTVSPAVTTTYRVIIEDGCTPLQDTDYVTIYVRPALDITLRPDTTICHGNSVLLIPVYGGGDSSHTITWDNGLGIGIDKNVSPSVTTTYRVIIEDGCTPVNDTDYVTIYVRPPLDIVLRPDTTICKGNQVLLAPVFSGGDSTYTFTWNNGLSDTTVHTVSPPLNNTYRVILSDGCSVQNDTDQVTIYVRPQLNIVFPFDSLICQGQSIDLTPSTLGGDSSYTITWDNGLGTGSSKTVSPTATTIYRAILSDGCTPENDTDYVTISVRDPLQVTALKDTTICLGQSAPLQAIAQGGRASTWQFDWDNGLGQGNAKTVSPTDTTIYSVILSDGCTVKNDTAFVTIRVSAPLEVYAGRDTLICQGSTITLKASAKNGFPPQHTFLWDNGLGTGSSKQVNPLFTTTYIVTLTDNCSPDVYDTVTVNVERLPLVNFYASDSFICVGEQVSFDNLSTGTSATYQYTWRFGDGLSSLLDEPTHSYKQAGFFKVTLIARSALGCTDSAVKNNYIQVNPNPVAAFRANPKEADYEFPQVKFHDESIIPSAWNWDFGDGNSSEGIPDPVHKYNDTGWYPVTLIVGTPEGCYDTTMRPFRVNDVFKFYIPVAFSPNGDGINDLFAYSGRGYMEVNLKIYNRWGELVFETDKKDVYWNGGVNNTGEQVPEGVYVYNITVRDVKKGLHHYSGDVTLIK